MNPFSFIECSCSLKLEFLAKPQDSLICKIETDVVKTAVCSEILLVHATSKRQSKTLAA